MPTLYILAGPNGGGKTTFYFTAIEQAFIDKDLSFIGVYMNLTIQRTILKLTEMNIDYRTCRKEIQKF